MEEFYSLDKLEVYKLANEIGEIVWDCVTQWSYFEKDTIGKQFVRSADSVSANIAEGYGRYFYKENIQFCYYSRGSLIETKVWMFKANKRKLINELAYNEMNEKIDQLQIKLNGYISYLKKNTTKK